MLVNFIKLKLKNKEIQDLRKNEVKYRTKDSVRLSRFDQSIKAKNCQTIKTNSITLRQV